jgi:hypothetical protein
MMSISERVTCKLANGLDTSSSSVLSILIWKLASVLNGGEGEKGYCSH